MHQPLFPRGRRLLAMYDEPAIARKQWFNSELFVKIAPMGLDGPTNGSSYDHLKSLGKFRLDAEHKILWHDTEVVPLGPKVVQTLAILVEHSGQVVSREDLLLHVWGDAVVEESNLAHNISALRKVLKNDPTAGLTIETVPRRGYRLCQVVLDKSSKPDHETSENLKRPMVFPAVPARALGRWRALPIIAAILIVGVLGVAVTARHLFPRNPKRHSVAVVGFANLSGQTDSAWLSPALSEMTNTELGVGGKLLTIPDETVARARAELNLQDQDGFSAETLARLFRDLHAEIVVSGAYTVLPANSLDKHSQADGQVRLDLRVQNAVTGELLDTVSESGQQSDLFEMVARAGSRVRQDLGVGIAIPQETIQARASVSSNPKAVRFYSEGAARLRSFDALGAKTWFQQAVDADRHYAVAHAALAEAYGVLGFENQAREEARVAYELAADLPQESRLAIEGRYRMATKDWGLAVQTYRTLHAIAPDNLDDGLSLASAETANSDGHGALQTLASLRRMPPPAGSDPRISLKEYEAWHSLGDFAHMETALAAAASQAKEQGALLLLARARSRQCWVERVRAETALALDHCREARQIYAVAGDRRGEAESLRFLADIVSSSDAQQALADYRQALALEYEIGYLSGEATIITQIGMLYSNQGEHKIAKQSFEQAMKMFQEQGDQQNAVGLSVDVAGELVAEGRLADGDEVYRQALSSAVQIHDKYIQAVVQYNLGFDQEIEGDLDGAATSYHQALASFQQVGDKEHDVEVLNNLGEVAMLQGDIANARSYYQQAMNSPQASQQKQQAAEAEMNLDRLALDQGQPAVRLEGSIRRIIELFRQGHDVRFDNAANDQALAVALLSRCLLSEGQLDAATRSMHEAVNIATKAAPDIRLTVAVSAARVGFAGPDLHEKTRAFTELKRVIAEARRFHYPVVELDAQLALGEIEVQSGALARGRARLHTVAAEASRRHYLLIARKAGAAA